MRNTIVNSVINRINANTKNFKKNNYSTPSNPNCLVLITGDKTLNNNEITFLNQLTKNYSITFALEFIAEHTPIKVDSLKKYTSTNFITESHFMEEGIELHAYDVVLALDLNVTSLAKIYHGILDEVIPYIAWQAIENAIPFIVNEQSILEAYNVKQFKERVQEYIDFLYLAGAKKIAEWKNKEKGIDDTFSENSNYSFEITEKIITTSNLVDFTDNSRVQVPSDAIITSLALDIIKQKQLTVIREE